MVQINFSLKEVNCKVVYYGPGLSGKTTNLEVVHSKAPQGSVGDLTSIATEGDRTLFFDFLPLNLGQVAGMKTKFQIYTVPGQVYYNSTRKLVLQGADGIVFVADSKKGKMAENLESLENLVENLREYGMNPETTPIVLQYNKRDLPEVYSIEEMNQALNKWNAPHYEAVARDGHGVFPTLKHLAGMVLESLNRQHSGGSVQARRPAPAAAVAVPAGAAMATAGGGGGRGAAPPNVASPRSGQGAAPQQPARGNAQQVQMRTRGQAVPMQTGVRVARPAIQVPNQNKKSKAKLWVVLGGLVVLAGAGAYLHFTGTLKDLLGG
jgi:signal recognition particle receptor subunit beta